MVSKKMIDLKSPRRTQVANACVACRASKVKCSGKHPECSRCRARGIECNFDVSAEGITKRQHLNNELALLAGHKEGLDRANAVIDVLQHGSDSEAVELLVCLRIGHTVEAAYEHIQSKRQGAASNLSGTPSSSAAASVISDMIPSRPPFMANDKSVQNVPGPTTIHGATSWSNPQRPINMGANNSSPTVTSHRPPTWPYPSMDNETGYFRQDNDPNAYTYQPTEGDAQADQFGLATPVSLVSTCSSSTMSNAQDSYIQQSYSREHLFFESTPRGSNNQATLTTLPSENISRWSTTSDCQSAEDLPSGGS